MIAGALSAPCTHRGAPSRVLPETLTRAVRRSVEFL
jgi:hypothetical protein